MKRHLPSLLALVAVALTAATAHADSAPKILIIDLSKIFSAHWKTQQEQAKMNDEETKAQKEFERMGNEGKALVEELKELNDEVKSPTASNEAKARAQAAVQKKYDEIQRKHAEQNEYAQNADKLFRQRMDAFKSLMFAEISKVAIDVAKKHGGLVVLDKSGPTMVGISNVVYYDPSLEITDEVMAIIDKDRPANLPPLSPTPGPSAAPAIGAPPTITVPGPAPGK
jgi:outer membrane protein